MAGAPPPYRFPWLLGDPGRDGRCRQLPVDAWYEAHQLVIEFRERQHDEPVAFFDHRATVSGVARGEQRRLYDLRRETEIPQHGLLLMIVRSRDLDCDRRATPEAKPRAGRGGAPDPSGSPRGLAIAADAPVCVQLGCTVRPLLEEQHDDTACASAARVQTRLASAGDPRAPRATRP